MTSLTVNVILILVAAAVPAIIAMGLITRSAAVLRAWADRLSPFWSALPGSIAVALATGLAAALMTMALSPGVDGGGRTTRPRAAGLVIAACVPQIVLVLGATTMLAVVNRSLLASAFHILAVYPVLAMLTTLALERDIRRMTRLGVEQDLEPFQIATVFGRVSGWRGFAIALGGATLVFQNYLINLCLSDDPSRDALVALGALSPHTGLDWAAVLSASAILWLCSAMVSAMLLAGSRSWRQRGADQYAR